MHGMEQVPPVGDDDIILVLKHRVRKELCGAHVLSAERPDRTPKDVESQEAWSVIIGVCDAEFLAEVAEADVSSAQSETNIVCAHTRLVQYVRAEVVGPVDDAIFQPSLVEGIEQ